MSSLSSAMDSKDDNSKDYVGNNITLLPLTPTTPNIGKEEEGGEENTIVNINKLNIAALPIPAAKQKKKPWKYRCRVSNDKDYLDRLHKRTGWTPSSSHIRPTPETIKEKITFLNEVLPLYRSEKDFILSDVFDCDTYVDEDSGLIGACGCDGIKDGDVENGECKNLCSDDSLFGKDIVTTTTTSSTTTSSSSSKLNQNNQSSKTYKLKFKPNKYPYLLPEGVEHFLLWIYPCPELPITPELEGKVNEFITNGIREVLVDQDGGVSLEGEGATVGDGGDGDGGGDDDMFDFVYYENPKMTICSVYHLQVFWKRL